MTSRPVQPAPPGTRFSSSVITEPALAPLAADLRRAMHAGPVPGSIVLDVCCGAGASALHLGRMTGPIGRVDAVDLSRQLTRHGTLAARRAGLRHVTFRSADVLDWVTRHPSEYDAVVCTLGLMFLPDPVHSLGTLTGALRPAADLVTTW